MLNGFAALVYERASGRKGSIIVKGMAGHVASIREARNAAN